MSSKKDPQSSLFDTDDDDDDPFLLPKRPTSAASRPPIPDENPLSFFAFGSSSSTPSTSKQPQKDIDTNDENEDDDFFVSPPNSQKKSVHRPSRTAVEIFNSSDDDDDLDFSPNDKKVPSSDLYKLSFKEEQTNPDSRSQKTQENKPSNLTDKQRIVALEAELKKANETIQKLKAKEKQDAISLEKALQAIESNLATQVSRADKAEAEKRKLEQDLRIQQDKLHQFQLQYKQQQIIIDQLNRGGVPLTQPMMSMSESQIDWHQIQEKHKYAIQLMAQASKEAKTGLDLLLKNTAVFSEVYTILKDIDRISDSH